MTLLKKVKDQKWFYEFDLPDGSKTESYLDEGARLIHVTREKVLRSHLDASERQYQSVLDISSHEGYFSNVLADYFKKVIGIDKNSASIEKSRLIAKLLGRKQISFTETSLEKYDAKNATDFVLCYGLLYHVENPIEILRKLASLTKKTLCLETQIMPFDMIGPVEDGHYLWQRELNGMFGLFADYSQRAEGGMTDFAMVPSRRALVFLLEGMGFKNIDFYLPETTDYEQFKRGQRVILFAQKE